MEIKQGANNSESSIASLLGFRKAVYKQDKYSSQKIVDIMGFSTINIHCSVITSVKDNGNHRYTIYFYSNRTNRLSNKNYTN